MQPLNQAAYDRLMDNLTLIEGWHIKQEWPLPLWVMQSFAELRKNGLAAKIRPPLSIKINALADAIRNQDAAEAARRTKIALNASAFSSTDSSKGDAPG